MKRRKVTTLAGMLASILACLCGQPALAESGSPLPAQDARPPVGGVASPEDAMIFYRAHNQKSVAQNGDGQNGACGSSCSDWVAAEGAVEWDTFKRLFAFLERFGARKLPVVLNVRGNGSLNVAMTLGKIIREHGLDVSVGTTFVAGCTNATDAACFARKRSGEPLDATVGTTAVGCDVVCVLALAGGVHRTLPAGARVIIGPTHIVNRVAPNVSKEQQQGLQASYSDQYRLYLKQMGVDPQVVDIIDRAAQTGHTIEISSQDWGRLGLATEPVR